MNDFTKRHTNIAKGVGILMMLWHHLFFDDPAYYGLFKSLNYINGTPVECHLASICKVCVAVFLFLSGYGSYKSFSKYQNNTIKNWLLFLVHRLTVLFTDYWLIFVIFVPMGFIFGRSPSEIYDNNFLCFLEDFFGLWYLLHGWYGKTMNQTWWFISIILVYYAIFPVIVRCIKKWPEAVPGAAALISIAFAGKHDLANCLFSFVLGTYFASRNVFSLLDSHVKNAANRFLFLTFILAALSIRRLAIVSDPIYCAFDGIFGTAIILFSFWFLSQLKYVSALLEKFGAYSNMIFMFHTFLFEYYFTDFVYKPKYAPAIFIVFSLICLFIAYVIDRIRFMFGINKLSLKTRHE